MREAEEVMGTFGDRWETGRPGVIRAAGRPAHRSEQREEL